MSATIRSTLWLGFFATILVAWVWLYQMSTGMGLDIFGRMAMPMTMDMDMDMGMEGGMDMEGGMSGDTAMPMAEPEPAMPMGDGAMPMDDGAVAMDDGAAMPMDMGGMDMSSMTRFGPLWGMWSVMMAAMMFPTLVPTLATYDRLIISADGTRSGWLGVLAGYAAVWVLVAAAFAGLQLGLLATGVIDMMGVATSHWIAAGLLVAVGAFQFTRAKEICHGVCHTPMAYFLGHWRPDLAGGVRMGAGLGAFCAGCCWGFMALGFVGGMMSLLWMGLATLFMVIEKLPQIGHYVTKPMGILLIAGGIAVAIWPML